MYKNVGLVYFIRTRGYQQTFINIGGNPLAGLYIKLAKQNKYTGFLFIFDHTVKNS